MGRIELTITRTAGINGGGTCRGSSMRAAWVVRRHMPGGDIDTLHATYAEARRVEREAIRAAATLHGLAYQITLFREGGAS